MAMRKSPGGTFIIETSTLAPSPRSMTRILPKTAEPPIARSDATSPYAVAVAFASGAVEARKAEHPATPATSAATSSAL